MDASLIDSHLSEIDSVGYTIIEDAIDPELNGQLRDAVRVCFTELGVEPKGNRAEGFATRRLYNLVPRAPIFQQLPVHDSVLPLVEALLEPECLLSGTTAMDIGPGERLQGLHADDGLFRIGRPHQPMMATTIWRSPTSQPKTELPEWFLDHTRNRVTLTPMMIRERLRPRCPRGASWLWTANSGIAAVRTARKGSGGSG